MKLFKRIILIILSILLCCISFFAASQIAKNFFFDKFYYSKSLAYGYKSYGPPDWSKAGKRAEDMLHILNQKVLGLSTENLFCDKYTIAIIGDSYVWGQGLTEKERFAHLLEKKLSKYVEVSVISLAAQGDDLIANYAKYLLAESKLNVDLYIFGMVDNDLLFNTYNHYMPNLISKVSTSCIQPLVFQVPEADMSIHDQVVRSYDEQYGNTCVAKHIASQLPKERAIYFNYFETYSFDPEPIMKYDSIFQGYNLEILSATNAATLDQYQKRYTVSKFEGHPSKWANEIFAETLEDYICNKYLKCIAK